MEGDIQIGNYILKKQIAQNETTTLFKGISKKNNEILFIKRINKSKVDSEWKKKLQRELNILKTLDKLKSQNIISLKDFTKSKNHYYLIFEYCNGGNLLNYVKEYIKENKKPLNEYYIQKIINQLVTTIEYMHANKIIHRNIKLENILLNFDRNFNIAKNGELPEELSFQDKSLNKTFTIKLADLKDAKILEGLTTTVLGSNISAPEIANAGEGNKGYGKSADLWSLGAITYELLTGLPPFEGKTSEEILKNIQEGIYTLPNNLKCSVEIITFINGLLQYYPEKRLNIHQIRSHPFLVKKPEEFQYIDLIRLSNSENEQIKMNSKDNDNLFWIFFKCKNFNLNIDKIDQEEIRKSNVKKMIEQSAIVNNDIKEASEKEEIEKKKEMQKIEDLKADAEEKIIKATLAKENQQKEQEKLINDGNNIENKKNALLQKKSTNYDESYETMESIELKLNKNKSDKEIIEDEIKNSEITINENQKILEMIKKQEQMEKENKFLMEELKKLREEITKGENESKITETEKQTMETTEGTNKSKITIDASMFSSCMILNDEDYKKIKNEDEDVSFDSDDDDFEFEDFTDKYELNVVEDYLKNEFAKIK